MWFYPIDLIFMFKHGKSCDDEGKYNYRRIELDTHFGKYKYEK